MPKSKTFPIGAHTKTLRLSPNVEVAGCMAENGRLFAVPPTGQPALFAGQKLLWVFRPGGGGVLLRTNRYRVKRTKKAVFLTLACPYQKVCFSALPPCDFTGNRFSFTVGGHDLTGTAAGLYWKNLVPECAERTLMRKNKTWRDGYVLSTLDLSVYAGTYPAVDHEFHIRAGWLWADSWKPTLCAVCWNCSFAPWQKTAAPAGAFPARCSEAAGANTACCERAKTAKRERRCSR